jgi:hypothetical protein
MGDLLYQEKYPKGTPVLIAARPDLEDFLPTWRYHHRLAPEQLNYAGLSARIASVGFYHGGDVLYELEGIPGTWHESCLTRDPVATHL